MIALLGDQKEDVMTNQKCDCFLAHHCNPTKRATAPLTWRGTVVFVLFPVVLAAGFVVLLVSLS